MTMTSLSIDDWYGHLVDVFQAFLLDTLRVSHLLCWLHIKEVKEIAHEIHELEERGESKEAAKRLLEAIKCSEEPGKWTTFLQALKEVDCKIVIEKLLEEEQDVRPWHNEHKELISIFSGNIEEKLNIGKILPSLRSILFDSDYSKIEHLSKIEPRNAIRLLLLLMHRRASDWYETFMRALINCEAEVRAVRSNSSDKNYRLLSELIDPQFVEKYMKAVMEGIEDESVIGRNKAEAKDEKEVVTQKGAKKKSPQGGVVKHILSGPGAEIFDKSNLQEAPRSKRNYVENPSLQQQNSAVAENLSPFSLEQLDTRDDNESNTGYVTVHTRYSPETQTQRMPSCTCGCCASVLTELHFLKQKLQEMSSLRSEEAEEMTALRSELADIKTILNKLLI